MSAVTLACIHCGRTVTAQGGRYALHTPIPGGDDYCPISGQPVPADGTTEDAWLRRAYILCHLAGQLRDRDPQLTHDWLAAQHRTELINLLTAAIAAIPLDGRPTDIWRWVYDLPAAQGAPA